MLTSLDFLNVGYEFPAVEEQGRIATYELNRALYKNDQSQLLDTILKVVYPDTDERNGLKHIYVNLYRSVSTMWGDLLFAEEPKINAEESQLKVINNIIKQNSFYKTSRKVALDVSRYGNGIYKVRLQDNKAVIEALSPSFWYPVVNTDNINEVQYHVIGYKFTQAVNTFYGQNITTYIKVEIHSKGKIEHRLYEMDKNNNRISKLLPLNYFERYAKLKEFEDTGIDDFLIVPVENQTDSESVFGYDDYTDINPIVSSICEHLTKFGRDLEQQGNLKYGPKNAIDEDGNVPRNGYIGLMGGANQDQMPGVVTWTVQYLAAREMIDQLMLFFYITSESSPALIYPDMQIGNLSGTALKRLMQRTLLKAGRLAENFDSSIKQVLKIAAQFEGSKLDDFEISWKDGLIEDLKEKSETASMAISSGTMSKKTGVAYVQDIEGSTLEDELKQIQAEKKEESALNLDDLYGNEESKPVNEAE